jgi:hypothetical protein
MDKRQRFFFDTIRDAGLRVVESHQRKHLRIRVVDGDGVEFVTTAPTSASDHRAMQNWQRDLRRQHNTARTYKETK